MTSSPGFFTSAMGLYDPSNTFDSASKDGSRSFTYAPSKSEENPFGFSPGTSPVPQDRKPPKTTTMLDLDGMSLGDSWTPRKDAMIIDPHLRQSIQGSKLHTNLPGSVRSQHGQITPPSDNTPTEEMWEDNDSSRRSSAPQQPPSTTSSASRRKRGTHATAAGEAPEPKRKRRSTGKRQSSSNADESPETDEKRTKFLERNRVAASKCRQKKKEWTSNLEERARQLQANKTQLSVMASSLRDEVLYLKGEMLEHKNCGCSRIRDYLSREAMVLSGGAPHNSFMPMQSTNDLDMDHSHSMHASPIQSSLSADTPGSDGELQAMLTAHMDRR